MNRSSIEYTLALSTGSHGSFIMEFPKLRRRSEVPTPRRVVTAPIPPSSPQLDSPAPHSLVETLYSHPNVKIIAFTASGRVFARGRAKGVDIVGDEVPGTLSWSSQLERTIAVGTRSSKRSFNKPFLTCLQDHFASTEPLALSLS